MSTYYTEILITAQQVANCHLFLHYNGITEFALYLSELTQSENIKTL
jgi:hypothetical protein